MVIFSKFSSESLHEDIDRRVVKCRKICLTGNRRNRALFTSQKIRLLVKSLCGSCPKSARASPNITLTLF